MELAEIPVDKDEEEETELVVLEPEALDELDPKQLQYQLTILEEKLAQSKPNLAVIQEYRKKVSTEGFLLTYYIKRLDILSHFFISRDNCRKWIEVKH